MNTEGFLARLLCRSALKDGEQCAILALTGQIEHVAAGRDFVPLGSVSGHVSLILSGLVARFDQTTDGKRQITAFHIAGDIPDLACVVQPRALISLQALSPVTVLRIPHADLRAVAARFPAIAEAFWRDTIVDAAILAQWVMNVGSRDAKAKIAHVLCEMAVRYRTRGQDHAPSFALPITQTQLGEATGITGIHVNRILQAMRSHASLLYGRVEILDWEALMRAGDFDASYLQMDLLPEERLRLAP